MTRFSAIFTSALLAAVLTTPGCRGNTPDDDEAAIRARLETTDTARLMEEVAKARFEPPADGRLTEAQVRMYLQVKELETKILAVAAQGAPSAGPGGDPGGPVMDDLVTAGLRAAQELGHNPKEYAWVEERVQEARMAEASQTLEQQLGDGRAKYLAMLEAEKAAADDVRKAEIELQIQEFRADAAESAPRLTPAVQANIALLAEHRQRIDQADAAEARAAAGRLQSQPTEDRGTE
jgi:hypothetical protein